MRIEAVFGGILVLFVLAVAAYAILTGGKRGPISIDPVDGGATVSAPSTPAALDAELCRCFSEGFNLAGSNVGVMSAQYRTGFEVCRTQLGESGGCAFTAGWNARISHRPFEANCRSFIKKGATC